MSGMTGHREYEPEAVPGWITRAEICALLGVTEIELREILQDFRLSRRPVTLYSKSEILALVAVAKRLG